MAISQKQRRFIDEYAIDLNATQAAIRAGYSKKTAHSAGPRLLEHVEVAKTIKLRTAAIAANLEITTERVIAGIAAIAFGDIRDLFDGTRLKRPDEWDDRAAAAVASLEVSWAGEGEEGTERVAKIKIADRLRALDMLARYLALYNDRVVVDVHEGLADRVARAKARGRLHMAD